MHWGLRITVGDVLGYLASGMTHTEILRPAEKALLIGAYFTREISLEGAALFNPSMVAHPDQGGLAPGETRFVMSLRAVGEGHISSIEFRTGIIGPAGAVRLDAAGKFPECGQYSPGPYSRDLFHAKLAERGCDNQAAAQVLDRLEPNFGSAQLESALESLHPDLLSRATVREAIVGIHWVAANNYTVQFAPETAVGRARALAARPCRAPGHGRRPLRTFRGRRRQPSPTSRPTPLSTKCTSPRNC